MACLITIHGLVAFRASTSQPPSSIVVFGAAHDCSQIDVTIATGSVTIGPRSATVDQQGGWSVEFTAPQHFAQGDLTCGAQTASTDVAAACHSDSSCNAALKIDDIPCQIVSACPTFDKLEADQVSDANNGCNADGTRRITFSAELSGTPSGTIVVEFVVRPAAGGNDINLGAVVPQPGQTFGCDANLLGGDYFYQLKIVAPTPCDGPGGFVTVQPCQQPPGIPIACPNIIINPMTVGTTCDAQNRRQVTASATVTPAPGNPVDARLQLQPAPGSPGLPTVTLQARTNQASAFQLQGTGSLPAGDYQVSVDITRPAGCGDASFPFNVPPCPGTTTPPPDDTDETDDDRPPRVVIPPPQESSGCGAARIIGLVLLFIGLALLLGGSCSGNVPLAVAGAIIAAVGAGIIIAWALLCPSISRCFALNRIIQMLEILVIVLAILSIVLGIIALIFPVEIGCFVGALSGTGIVGGLLAVLYMISRAIGCASFLGLTAVRR